MALSSDPITQLESQTRSLRRDNSELSERIQKLENSLQRIAESVQPRRLSEDLGRDVDERLFGLGLF